MIEWNLFYKMLGIPEEIAEPTFYDLLGLHPETCSAELVDRMLRTQKKMLRQNIPGPQFIPLILSFEQKKLERAAAVLRDPSTRQKYHEYLQKKASRRRRENQKERERQHLLRQVRDSVNSVLAPDKTLDDSKRPILAARLRELGIGEPRINSLLKRIPGPAQDGVRTSDETMEYFVTAVDLAIGGDRLTPDAERALMQLARKLNIDERQAVDKIDQELKRRNAHRGRRDASRLERDFENRVRSMIPGGSATEDQYELLLAMARVDNLPETSARNVLRRCLKVADGPGLVQQYERQDPAKSIHQEESEGAAVIGPPDETGQFAAIRQRVRRQRSIAPMALIVIVMACFVLAVGFLGTRGVQFLRRLVPSTTQTSSSDRGGEHLKKQEDPKTPSEAGGDSPHEQEPDESRLSPRAVRESPEPTEEQQEHMLTSPSGGSTLLTSRLQITAEDVRRVYSESARTEELLADLAMTMFACYCRARHFTLGLTDSNDELRTQMREPGRSSYLTRAVTVVQMAPAAGVAEGATPEAEQPQSKTAGGRPRSQSGPDPIEQLRMEDTPDAANKLLDSLKKRSVRSPGRIHMVARTLRALSTMTDPGIPQRLIEMLPASSPEVAFQIARTLARASGMNPSHERLTSGLLPPVNTSAQRQACAQWWNDNRPAWGLAQSARPTSSGVASPPPIQTTRGRRPAAPGPSSGRRAGSAQVESRPPTVTAAAWEPDPRIIKLLAATGHYAEITGDILKKHKWGTEAPAAPSGSGARTFGVTCSASTVGTDLLDSLGVISNELSRIITEHPEYEKATPMIDAIRLHEKDPRLAACQSQLQKAVVSLDATAELLIVLVRQADPNDQLRDVLTRIEQERSRALNEAINVVHELRESCYYNLVLWDILIESNIGEAITLATDTAVRRVQP